MKTGWITRPIGRHFIDLPGDARTIEEYAYNSLKIDPMPELPTRTSLERFVAQQEKILRAEKHELFGSMFIERVSHENGSVTIVSWEAPSLDIFYQFDTYFRAGDRTLKYAGKVSKSRRGAALSLRQDLSREWRQIPLGETPVGIGYVVDDTILEDKVMNLESWRMAIQLAGKPDVSFTVTAYTQRSVEPGLRRRAGGALASLLGTVAGVGQLRNRERPVGPIQADEILIAGTQDGKRTYGFKWEAPGKADSLSEPNLNVSLQVGESAYSTNRESFVSDEEALELWDAVVGSLRLRPGAV
ncbi:T6SS immunity protein Tli4 family protein [Cupriavidus sp. UYPR2.512]|uniref:T6SS immunity protein Tli4 family protein n=1 Tax=Cupriavidus sp. UYPR2.512 TaxID=1080187 RepID=UPI000476B4F7|nr:T6SS immunity protein Tli4 family protein [Cupriavidus sp. UYPR2.512]UIF87520.1 hypothetical protein KAF44_08515 [Cupriavidus necator]